MNKLLKIFAEIFYLDKFSNLFLFKNMMRFSIDFFEIFFRNLDFCVVSRFFTLLETMGDIYFVNKNIKHPRKKLKRNKCVFYVYDNSQGFAFDI